MTAILCVKYDYNLSKLIYPQMYQLISLDNDMIEWYNIIVIYDAYCNNDK